MQRRNSTDFQSRWASQHFGARKRQRFRIGERLQTTATGHDDWAEARIPTDTAATSAAAIATASRLTNPTLVPLQSSSNLA